jgi:hypothetical protein
VGKIYGRPDAGRALEETVAMVDVVFVLRGRTVAIDEIEDERERAALREIARSIRDRVGGLRCPEHDAAPRITATGSRADALEFDLAGCCSEFLETTAACFQ